MSNKNDAEAEAAAYFEALDYALENSRTLGPRPVVVLPVARVKTSKWGWLTSRRRSDS